MSVHIPQFRAQRGNYDPRVDPKIGGILTTKSGRDALNIWLNAHVGNLQRVTEDVEGGVSQKPYGPNMAPIDIAAREGHLHVVQYLAENGMRYCSSVPANALKLAAKRGHLEIVRYLLTIEDQNQRLLCEGTTLMSCFVGVDNLALVIHLCEAENVVVDERDSYDRTALMKAASSDNIAIATYLLKRHADVNAVSHAGEPAENENPLRNAACLGFTRMVRLLLDKGANIENTDGFGRTALVMATENNHFKTSLLLLRRGANINCTDIWGQTPVYYAASQGMLPMVKMLQKQNADTTICCEDGLTPAEAAAKHSFQNIADYLLIPTAQTPTEQTILRITPSTPMQGTP